MTDERAPDALLLLSTHCPHCPAMLHTLAEMIKNGSVGRLEVVNLETYPDVAKRYGVRSVPWLRLGAFELTGVRSRDELETWALRAGSEDGMADYFHTLLMEGQLPKVIETVQRQPEILVALLPVVANPDASINVRIGAGAVFEELDGQPAMQALTEGLGELSADSDSRVRADACHYLSFTRVPAARDYLQARLQDSDDVVREIAAESLQRLEQGLSDIPAPDS